MIETMLVGTITAIEERPSGIRVFINVAEPFGTIVYSDESYHDFAAMGLKIGGRVEVMEVHNEQAESEYSIQSQLS